MNTKEEIHPLKNHVNTYRFIEYPSSKVNDMDILSIFGELTNYMSVPMKRGKLTLILFSILLSVKVWAVREQSLHFSQISTQNGLSQNTVRSILEDRKGFIWAGTLDGLNRYDGYRIFAYKPQLGNSNSLQDHRVKDIFQDKDGLLWIKTYQNKFSCYDPVTESFLDYPIPTNDPIYANYYEASNGDIWLWGHTHGCVRISKDGHSFISQSFLTENISQNDWNYRFLFEDSKSVIWVGGKSGLYNIIDNEVNSFFKNEYHFTNAVELNNKVFFITTEGVIIEYDHKRKSFEVIEENKPGTRLVYIAKYDNSTLLITSWAREVFLFNINTRTYEVPAWAIKDKDLEKGHIDMILDKKEGIWLYNHTGYVWYWNPEKQEFRKIKLIPDDIVETIDMERYNIFIDSKEWIWITTYGNGLFCYNPEKDTFQHYTYREDGNSPASDYLLSITEDRFGNIWIGSEYAGIIKVIRSNYDIEIIRPEKETAIGRNNNVRTVYGDAYGKIWVGTKNGNLYIYNKSYTKNEHVYKGLNAYAICEDNKKQVWIGTKGKGLYLIDMINYKEIARYTQGTDSTNLTSNAIFDILRDDKNRMWIATFEKGINLAQETPDGKFTFRSFFNDMSNRRFVRYITQDINGYMWAGTSDGIIYFNPDELINDSTAYKVYQMNLDETYSLNCNDIKTIYEDEDGYIWIGTAGGGLNKFIPATEERKEHFINYTTKDGLSGDFISGILEDRNNNLWISTESGITKFDKKNNTFLDFNFSDKTYGNHFNENANVVDQHGYMLWGSLDGLLRIDPESFIPGENTPPVTLTNFFIYDQRMTAGEENSPLEQSISYSDKIKLNYKQNTFTIEFATLALTDPAKNKYEYILENYDKQWSLISNVNAATYKNLSPGKYTFKVRGSNSDGIWNEEFTQLDIIIAPPLWKAWYAYILYTLFTILALYVAFRLILKFNDLNNNVKIERELTSHKLRFFTNISHEFRTPLTLIRGAVENLNDLSDISPQTKRQVDVLSRNSTILTRLIDQLLEFRKLQNNVLTLNLEKTDIIDFSKEIFNSFHETALRKNIAYTLHTNPDTYDLFIDKTKVDKILYNLLSNAFKFTPADGKIELSVTIDENSRTCLMKVKDNGAGIEKDKQHLLFSRFMQINFSNLGTGVGLSLVKEFVEAHKGKIWYEDNEGQGSVFNVELSTAPETYQGENFVTPPEKKVAQVDPENKILYPSEDTLDIQLPDIDDATLSNYKMLVIDDNDDIRNFLMEEFSKHFMVDVAEDGEKGLQKAIETNPDLIICDVMMPGIDGFEVTRRLKTDFQTCHIPIVLLTAHSSIEHQLEGIESGADAYIMKPFSLKYLVTRVFKLIEHREQLKKRFSNEYVLDGNLITNTDKDKAFFELIDTILEEHMDDTQFSVDKFAELAKLKRTLFYKKVKGLTGLSPNELIKVKRLKKAAELLLQGELTVSEIAYKVGYDDPFYFSKCFKTHYKCTPSKYGQLQNEKEEVENE